jgi:hypothetical protein
MKRIFIGFSILVCFLYVVPRGTAQTASGPAGHWEGTIKAPGQELAIQVDLVADKAGVWQGTIAIPPQGIKAFPLSALSVQDNTITFAMKGIAGEPTFKGTLSDSPRSISGDFTQGGMTMPFKLEWKRESTLVVAPKSPPIGKELEGTWNGALEVGGSKLRMVLKLANQDGAAVGTLVSVDQGGTELPIAPIEQTASHVKLTVGAVGGTYEGDLKEGRLVGTWTQGAFGLPLVFSRAPM